MNRFLILSCIGTINGIARIRKPAKEVKMATAAIKRKINYLSIDIAYHKQNSIPFTI